MNIDKFDNLVVPKEVENIIGTLEQYGGKVYLVGGMVRDILMDKREKDDWDFEVFNLTPEAIEEILRIPMVGNHTGVFSIVENGIEIQIALPRTDIKINKPNSDKAYMDYEFLIDPYMTIEQAARRRDFTINAIYYDTVKHELIDPTNGIADIQKKILRPVSDTLFADDSVRILRAARFSNRFGLEWSESLIELGLNVVHELQYQTPARIKIELIKMLKTSTNADGFVYLADIGAYNYILTFFYDMLNCFHDSPYHLEGNIFNHTMLVFEALCRERENGIDVKPYTMMAGLLHDIGKPVTKEYNKEKGHYTFYKHEIVGVDLAIDALRSIDPEIDNCYIKNVPNLVRHHMQRTHKNFMRMLRKYGKEFVLQMITLQIADCLGRYPLDTEILHSLYEEREYFQNYFEFEPIVTGRMLISLGYEPGRAFSYVLNKCAELQIDKGLPDWSELVTMIDRFFAEYKISVEKE